MEEVRWTLDLLLYAANLLNYILKSITHVEKLSVAQPLILDSSKLIQLCKV